MQNTPPGPRRVRSAHESRSATVRAAAAAPSRRQLSKWQREQRQQHALYIAVGVLALVVGAILAGGIVYDNVVRANEVVAQIGPDSITAAQLLDAMRPAARRIDAQAKEAGGGANVAQYVDSAKRDLPDSTLNTLVDQHLIAQEAARRGLTVSPAEVEDRERETVARVNASNNPSPTPEATSTPAGSDAATPEAAATPDVNQSPTPVPTLDSDAYGPALQQLLDQSGLTEAELRDQLQQTILREKVQAAIGQDQVPDVQEQVHARHILLAAEDQANDVLQQLQNGADFAQLASQRSTDTTSTSKGGDLGWLPRGVMDKAFDDAAFALQPGQLSSVVHETGGFDVIQVLERDPSRPVAADQLQTLRLKAFTDWQTSRRGSQDVKLELSSGARNWVLTRVGVRP